MSGGLITDLVPRDCACYFLGYSLQFFALNDVPFLVHGVLLLAYSLFKLPKIVLILLTE